MSRRKPVNPEAAAFSPPAVPSVLDLLTSVGVLDAALVAAFNTWRERFPQGKPPLDIAEMWLRQWWSNAHLQKLPPLILAELMDLADGAGPVTNDPVDTA